MSNARGSVHVSCTDSSAICIIALAGEHDVSTARLIDARTPEIWPRRSMAIVDLTSATFIDSSVVNWIVRTSGTRDAQGFSDALRIVEGPERTAIEVVFQPLAVRDTFTCYRTVPDAVAGAATSRLRRSSAPGADGRNRGVTWQSTIPLRDALRSTRGAR